MILPTPVALRERSVFTVEAFTLSRRGTRHRKVRRSRIDKGRELLAVELSGEHGAALIVEAEAHRSGNREIGRVTVLQPVTV